MARKKRRTPPRYTSGPKKGQFKPRKASKPKRKTASAPRGKTTTMARRRRRRSSRKRSGGSKGTSFKKQAQDLMIGGAAYGFLTGSQSAAPSINTALAKVPTIGNRDITNGIALYFANKHLIRNKYVKDMALAALVSGAKDFGAAGFSLQGAGVGGWDDAIDVTEDGEEVSGIID